jgi:hypothetical protein
MPTRDIPQLTAAELAAFRRLRQAAQPYSVIAEHFGITMRMAHRILTVPNYQLSELSLLRIRNAIAARQAARRRSRRTTREVSA